MTGPFPEYSHSPAELALDPEMLANELAEELLGDPLDDLDALEAEQADLHQALGNPTLFRDSPARAREIQLRLETLEVEITEAIERWETLETLSPDGG